VLLLPVATLPKLRAEDDALSVPATPVPASVTCCVPPVALSVTFSVPVTAPLAVGQKTTLMLQLAPAATVLPQVLPAEKGLAVAIELMVRVALPVLVSVTVCAELLLFTHSLLKFRLVGDRLTVGVAVEAPDPVTLIGSVGSDALLLTVTVPE
jgi:hypothetical protein